MPTPAILFVPVGNLTVMRHLVDAERAKVRKVIDEIQHKNPDLARLKRVALGVLNDIAENIDQSISRLLPSARTPEAEV